MIFGGFVIIAFYCLGQLTQQQLALPIPGSVIGMLYMLIYLIWRKKTPTYLKKASHTLISNLALLLIPSCVGVMTCFNMLQQQGLLIAASVLLSIFSSIIITVWLLNIFKQRIGDTTEQYDSQPLINQP